MSKAPKKPVKPITPDRIRRKKLSERTQRDEEYERWVEEIKRNAVRLVQTDMSRAELVMTVIQACKLYPALVSDLIDSIKRATKGREPFEALLNKLTKTIEPPQEPTKEQ